MPDPKPTHEAPEPLAAQSAAVTASLVGLGAQLLLVAAGFVLQSQRLIPALDLLPFAFLGLFVWAAVVVAAVLRKARATEAYELEAASRDGDAARTIFDSEIDARPTARRLEKFLRLGVPAAGVIVGLGCVTLGLRGLRTALATDYSRFPLPDADLLAGAAGGAAFVGFVAGFYLLGMGAGARRPLIRGGAVYLLGGVIMFALVAAAAAAKAALDIDWLVKPVGILLPAITFAVGLEILLNLVLELYRPVAAGETLDDRRPAFNPRLVEVVVSPGGVAKQLNEAFRYQFGFEVTQSWFAGVLKRSAAGLLLAGVAVLVLLSSIVVVNPQQLAIVTTFGKLADAPLEPGLHLKWPWPVGRAYVEDIARVNRLIVGTHTDGRDHPAFLWENQHTGDSDLFLLGAAGAVIESSTDGTTSRAPAVSLAAADLTLLWKIEPDQLHLFVTGYAQPVRRLEILARQSLARELARYDVDQAIGAERVVVAKAIEDRLRLAVEAEPLGIEILSVGLNSVRPPQSIADSFNSTVAAEQDKLRLTEQGRAAAEATLSQVAGSPDEARRIARMIDDLPTSGDDLAAREAQVSAEIRNAGGTAADLLLQARGGRYEQEAQARARTARARALADAFAQARELISSRLRLSALAEAFADRPKDFYLTDAPIHLEFEGDKSLGIAGGRNLNIGSGEEGQ